VKFYGALQRPRAGVVCGYQNTFMHGERDKYALFLLSDGRLGRMGDRPQTARQLLSGPGSYGGIVEDLQRIIDQYGRTGTTQP
jgi:hypothetical protein